MIRSLAILALVGTTLLGASCHSNPNEPLGIGSYSITGSATRVDVTYQSSGGGTSQASGIIPPWFYALSGLRSGDFLYVSAQITATSGGSITVTASKDGATCKSATATGFPSIATASCTY